MSDNQKPFSSHFEFVLIGVCLILICTSGCGTTTNRSATEQLLMSDAVDLAVAQIDFRPLSNQRVYLDNTYLQTVKGQAFVNAPYIISSLRQQLTAAGCMLQDNREDAHIIVEPRVGALGTDGHEIAYGLPQTGALTSAASLITSTPGIPAIPELSVARVDAQSGIAKVMVFAYERESRQPIWQSGIARAESTSRNSWLLGAGPFQKGTVHGGVRFAGSKINSEADAPSIDYRPTVPYFSEHEFAPPIRAEESPRVADSPKEEDPDGAL